MPNLWLQESKKIWCLNEAVYRTLTPAKQGNRRKLEKSVQRTRLTNDHN